MTRLGSDGDNRPISEIYRQAGEDWADKEAAAAILEDTKSAVMAQWQAELGDIPVNRAEQMVKTQRRWTELIHNTVEARKLANIAKVKLEVVRMQFHEANNADANHRLEMRMTT